MAFFPSAVSRGWLPLAVFVLVAAEPKPDPAATRDYAVAVGLEARQLYDQAAQRWQKFIATYPKDSRLVHAYHHLGACQLKGRQPAAAARTFATLIDKFPKSDTLDAAHFNRGLALYDVGLASKKADDLRTAAGVFAVVEARFPRSKHAGPALYYQGECLYQAGDPAGAATLYRKAIAEHPASSVLPDATYALGTVQQELGQDKEAAATFRAFLGKFPKDRLAGECRVRLGMSLLKQKQYAEAAKLFDQSAALPDFPLADFALMQQAQCVYEQNHLPQAAALYETLPKKFPTSTRAGAALLAAGKCWYRAGDLPRAEAALKAALTRKFDEAPEAAYWLGQALLKRNRSADAEAVLARAIIAYPRSSFLPQLVFTRTEALAAQPARRKEAARLFADFTGKYPKHELTPRAFYLAALALLQAEDYAAARDQAEAFLKAFGRHELAAEVLFVGGEACLGGTTPDAPRAERLFRRLFTDHPRHKRAPQARVRVGLCLYLAKKYPDAVTFLTQSLRELREPALIAEVHLLMGRSHHDAGQAAEAIAALRKAIQVNPAWDRGDEVLLALAQGLRAQKKLDEAVVSLQRLHTAYPRSPYAAHALYQLGEIAHERKRYDEAVKHYEQTVARYPKSDAAPLAGHGIGLVWFAKKDYPRAVEAFGKQLAAYPGGTAAARARHLRGLSYRRLGKFEPAANDLTAFLASRPPAKESHEARYALALCQSALKRYAQAAATLAVLLQEKPDQARADKIYYEMAHCLLQAGKGKEAAAAFRQLAVKTPDSPLVAESWFRVGEFHQGAREYPEAAQAYTAGLKTKEAGLREKLHYKLGWVQYQRGRFAEAAKVLRAQLRDYPGGELATDATYLTGDCLFRQDQFAEARPLFERLMRVRDKKYHARSLYRCGACLAGLKEWAGSRKCYEELIREFPKFDLLQEARYGLGWALQNEGKLDEARPIYEQVTKATNTETAAKCRFMIGECAFRQKKHKEAVEHFLEAALAYPYAEWQALGHFEAGRCFIALKDNARALQELRIVVKKFPKHPRARDAAGLIADLEKGTR